MHPLPTSIHSSTDSPSLLMVRDFSISRAIYHVSSRRALAGLNMAYSHQTLHILVSESRYMRRGRERRPILPFMITAIFFPCSAVRM